MKNYFREYFWLKKCIQGNVFLFDSIKEYMKEGQYRSAVTGNIIYPLVDAEGEYNQSTFDGIRFQGNITGLLLDKISQKNLIDCKPCSEATGEYCIISSSRTEIKVFDKKKNRVITFFYEKEKKTRIERERQRIASWYNIPAIVEADKPSEHILMEKLIKVQKCEHENALQNIMWQYIEKADIDKKGYYKNELKWESDIECFTEKFRVSLEFKEILKLPFSYTHGDLWSSNILFDGQTYFVTDFEAVGERYFLYDFFMFIYTEWFLLDDPKLLYHYFQGCYDDILLNIFRINGLIYDTGKRNVYFLGYLIAIYTERWIKAKSWKIDRKVKQTLNRL